MSLGARARRLAVAVAFLGLTVTGALTAQRESSAEPTLVVWPVGDSITYGAEARPHTVPGGYRAPLARVLAGRGIRVHFVGTLATNPSSLLRSAGQRHDGHSGWQISDVLAHIDTWQVPTPDVVLVSLGTNDNRRGHVTPVEAVGRLADLVADLAVRFPDAELVVTAIVPSGRAGSCDGWTREYDGRVRALVRDERLSGRKVTLADAWSAFTYGACSTRAGLLSRDRLHPSAAGYALLGGVFADVVAPLAESRRTLTP